MTGHIAVDTNAIIASLRPDARDRAPLNRAAAIIVPLPVLGELYAGAFSSAKRDANLQLIAGVLAEAPVIRPDADTARLYGQLRAAHRLDDIRTAKRNDLWIAALCIQHSLPLLTNDRGFDPIAGLTVIHW